MKLEIGGELYDVEASTFSALRASAAPGAETAAYVLEVNAEDFMRRFSPVYDDCIVELRRDDDIVGKFHPPYPGATDYPSLEAFFELPEWSRMEFVRKHFRADIFELYLKEESIGPGVKWRLVGIDSLLRDGATVRICGNAQKLRP